MKRRIINIAIYASVILTAVILVGVSNGYRKHKPCKDFKVILKNDLNNYFLDLEAVRNLVRDVYGSPVEGSNLGDIKVSEIEYELRNNPYIKGAEVYKDISGNLVVEIELRKPLARVMGANGDGFYLDQDFYKVPLTESFSANTILIRGYVDEPAEPRDSINNDYLFGVLNLVEYIDKDPLFEVSGF